MLLMSPKGERDREFFLRNLMKKIDIGIQSVCIYTYLTSKYLSRALLVRDKTMIII